MPMLQVGYLGVFIFLHEDLRVLREYILYDTYFFLLKTSITWGSLGTFEQLLKELMESCQ